MSAELVGSRGAWTEIATLYGRGFRRALVGAAPAVAMPLLTADLGDKGDRVPG